MSAAAPAATGALVATLAVAGRSDYKPGAVTAMEALVRHEPRGH